MRLYVTDTQMSVIGQCLMKKVIASVIVHDALQLGSLACDKKSWGCVLCPVYGPSDSEWLLKAWNKEIHELIQVAIVQTGEIQCLLACPTWAVDDPYVRMIVRKLSGTKSPASPVDWEKCDGLVPVIAQDAVTGEVLMQAFMDEVAFAETVSTGRACYFTRSRRKLWRKGEESGNVQIVKEIAVDCDRDSVVMKVEQVGGAACHDGYRSCFYRRIECDNSLTIVGERAFDPAQVYKKEK